MNHEENAGARDQQDLALPCGLAGLPALDVPAARREAIRRRGHAALERRAAAARGCATPVGTGRRIVPRAVAAALRVAIPAGAGLLASGLIARLAAVAAAVLGAR